MESPRRPPTNGTLLSADACAICGLRHSLQPRVASAIADLCAAKDRRRALAIKAGRQDKLVLGDLDAVADWGYAPDYVEAMMRMLALNVPDDFVIATGVPRTVRQFAETAFDLVGLDWQSHVEVAPNLFPGEAALWLAAREPIGRHRLEALRLICRLGPNPRPGRGGQEDAYMKQDHGVVTGGAVPVETAVRPAISGRHEYTK